MRDGIKIGDLLSLSLSEVQALGDDSLTATWEYFKLLSKLPFRGLALEFHDLPQQDQKVFKEIKSWVLCETQARRVFATGSRVHGRVSEQAVYSRSGILIRKKSDFDILIEPIPEDVVDIGARASQALGHSVDVMPCWPGSYSPIEIP